MTDKDKKELEKQIIRWGCTLCYGNMIDMHGKPCPLANDHRANEEHNNKIREKLGKSDGIVF